MTAEIRPHLVANCVSDGEAHTLTVYRDQTPEGDRGATLLALLLDTMGVDLARLEPGTVTVHQLHSGSGFGIIYAPGVFQLRSMAFRVYGTAERTDIVRKPYVNPDHPVYLFAMNHVRRHGQAAQDRRSGPGGMVHEPHWLPEFEVGDAPGVADAIDILAVLGGLRGGTA